MELVLLKDPPEIEDLAGRHTAGFCAHPPSRYLDAKLQLVIDGRKAEKDTQLLVHDLTHGAVAIRFPLGSPLTARRHGLLSLAEAPTRVGAPRFVDGFPSDDTVERVYDKLDFIRGVDAFISTLSGASLVAMRRGFRDPVDPGRAVQDIKKPIKIYPLEFEISDEESDLTAQARAEDTDAGEEQEEMVRFVRMTGKPMNTIHSNDFGIGFRPCPAKAGSRSCGCTAP